MHNTSWLNKSHRNILCSLISSSSLSVAERKEAQTLPGPWDNSFVQAKFWLESGWKV